MAPILQRIQQSCAISLPLRYDSDNALWSFSENLNQVGKSEPDFFPKLIKHMRTLMMDYSVHCTRLVSTLKTGVALNTLRPQVEDALVMAEILIVIYRLVKPNEVAKARRARDSLRDLMQLCDANFHFTNEKEESLPSSLIQEILNQSIIVNRFRLLLVRSRRLLITVSPVAKQARNYHHWIQKMELSTAPIVIHLAWTFFLPRLIINLAYITQHTLPWGQTEAALALGWKTRLHAQLTQRWFELGNDTAWLINGVVNCFVLTGLLAPIGLYLNVAMQAYDVVLASTRAHVEIRRLKNLEQEYKVLQKTFDENSSDYAQIEDHLHYLKQRIAYERKQVAVPVINMVALLIAVSLAVPLLIANPIAPMVGAIIAVLVTILSHLAVKYLEKKRPGDSVTSWVEKKKSEQLENTENIKKPSVVSHSLFNRNRSASAPPALGSTFDMEPFSIQ